MKHPILTDRIRLIVWWLVWLFTTLGQTLLYNFAYGSFTASLIPDAIVSFVTFSGIGLSLWYPFRYIIAASKNTTGVIVNNLLAGIASLSLWLLVTRYGVPLLLPALNDYQDYWVSTFPYRIGTGIFIFVLIMLAYYLFLNLSNLAAKNAKAVELENLVRDTELKMLRSQINPHFLFNSLNSISYLTITDPERAREMLIKLSDFMRYALSKKDEQPVTLRSELENLRLYLEIEKVRFGERLTTEENIEEKCLEIKMPVMILQPLYENAIKHGVYESTECVSIKTKVACKNGYLEIIISNNYETNTTPLKGTGTGLQNVARRLDIFYNKKAFIKTSKENGIYTVTLFIPSAV
ncbi:MAG TPA: histidine kinase [Bacteroidales bacterium]|jgi:sensor histidine kinase YesM|nr:histidine kinase [Bacteroidales bacterium]